MSEPAPTTHGRSRGRAVLTRGTAWLEQDPAYAGVICAQDLYRAALRVDPSGTLGPLSAFLQDPATAVRESLDEQGRHRRAPFPPAAVDVAVSAAADWLPVGSKYANPLTDMSDDELRAALARMLNAREGARRAALVALTALLDVPMTAAKFEDLGRLARALGLEGALPGELERSSMGVDGAWERAMSVIQPDRKR